VFLRSIGLQDGNASKYLQPNSIERDFILDQFFRPRNILLETGSRYRMEQPPKKYKKNGDH
jgi:hypothetical protein